MRKYNTVLVFLIGFISFHKGCGYQTFKIAGIFGMSERDQELAFKLGVSMVNKNPKHSVVKLQAVTKRIDKENTLEVSKITCSLLNLGLVGLFGPSETSTSEYVTSVCDSKEIPHIDVHEDISSRCTRCLINVHPNPPVVTTAVIDLIHRLQWRKFTFVYENFDSLPRISQILNMCDYQDHEIKIRELEDDDGMGNYKKLLKYLKGSGDTHFILDMSIEVLEEFLKQCQQVGLITERHHFIITNLDMQTINLGGYQDSGCFIMGLSLTNPISDDLKQVGQELQAMGAHVKDHFSRVFYSWKIKLNTALIIDAVQLFYEALLEMKRKGLLEVKPLYCNSTENFRAGTTLINYMKTKTIKGLTGDLKFDTSGLRSEFSLNILQLTESSLMKVGTWNATGMDIKTYEHPSVVINDGTLRNVTFKIITALVAPYTMLKETSINLHGNNRFEGFCIDIIDELSRELLFNYTYEIQEDGVYGKNVSKGVWNGMIGKIMDGTVDLGIADFTITSEREKAVDFTLPFMNLGISILYRKPEPVPPSLFTFASPFSPDVWAMVAVAYFFVSISLFLIARLNPKEWDNQNPCIEEPEYLTNQFGLRDTFFFVVGSLLQQGSDIAPSGISTRMIAGLWWFFTLIMVSSYTANLCAFLTVETLITPFNSIDELVNQNVIKFGAKADGATASYFQESELENYHKVSEYMKQNPGVMTHNNEEGIDRVLYQNYAFLMESTSIEYTTERKCNLTQVGKLLDEKGYGIAMKKDSPYRNALSTAILKLQESGKLTELKARWWKEKRGGGFCSKRPSSQATPLNFNNVGGVFFVMTVGTVCGVFFCVLEVVLHIRNIAKKENKRFKEILKEEIAFFLKFKEMSRPVRSANVSIASSNNS